MANYLHSKSACGKHVCGKDVYGKTTEHEES